MFALSTFRVKLDLTQAAFARALGLSQPYLCQLENGSRPFTLVPTDLPLNTAAVSLRADELAVF